MKHLVMWILSAQLYALFCLVSTGPTWTPHVDLFQLTNLTEELSLTTESVAPAKEKTSDYSVEHELVQLLIEGEPLLSPRGRKPVPHFDSNLEDFPPGRPSRANIGNLCEMKRLNVSYGPHNLPQTGYSHLSRQGQAINELEEGFTRCCLQSDKLPCAKDVWEKAMDNFCSEEWGVKTVAYACCNRQDKALMYRCFAKKAPIPEYDRKVEMLNLSIVTENILEKLCGGFKLLTKTNHLSLLTSGLRDSCCSLPQNRKLRCAETQKKKYIKTLCGCKNGSWKDTQDCCSKDEQGRGECFSYYLQNVSVTFMEREVQNSTTVVQTRLNTNPGSDNLLQQHPCKKVLP
ncbi:extracellular matrix protein 1-like isoform X2 [Mixophyes fleayi]|uniref:extracellular matrix protein 1-like isoform X2 n=1 Tax=Mixophyes fleayi TaxID=3061075 RepID=UPI003F4DFAC3